MDWPETGLEHDSCSAGSILCWSHAGITCCIPACQGSRWTGAGAPALDMPTIHCYFENKAAAACATSALNKFCSICTAFRCLHRIWDRPSFCYAYWFLKSLWISFLLRPDSFRCQRHRDSRFSAFDKTASGLRPIHHCQAHLGLRSPARWCGNSCGSGIVPPVLQYPRRSVPRRRRRPTFAIWSTLTASYPSFANSFTASIRIRCFVVAFFIIPPKKLTIVSWIIS